MLDAVKAGPSWSNWSPRHINLIVNFLIKQRNTPHRMTGYRDPEVYDQLFEKRCAHVHAHVALFVLAASEMVGEVITQR